MSANPIPLSTPSFWDTVKLMFSIGGGNPSPQEQGKPTSPGEDRKQEEEQQQQQIKGLDTSRSHNVF